MHTIGMKVKKETALFIRSTFTVLLTSTLISLAVWMLNGNYLASFILAFSIQYILFGFIGSIINNYFNQITRQKELDKLEQLSTILECAYCKKHNVMTFIPDENERVEFMCENCEKKNYVNINFTVARVTEPLALTPTIPDPSIPAIPVTKKD
ncbi:MAG: hypothetical protein EBU90_00840 [Proteobacteria bacterium]|nr:hypothetical protein [Pseudomonadota bacterium]NBP12979.1 hypothetical protein [bacterium]